MCRNAKPVCEELGVREQDLDHAGAIDEICDVGLGNGAADRLELPPNRQIFEIKAETQGFHCKSPRARRRDVATD